MMKEQFISLGDTVLCDLCNEDYTDSSESGGFIFGSTAYCPPCATKSLPTIHEYDEEGYISAYCPEDQSFSDFVRAYRGGEGTIRIITWD